MCHRITICIDSLLKHYAANRKRRLSALPNVGPYIYIYIYVYIYIYMMLKFLALEGAPYIYIYIYIYDISRLRVNNKWFKGCNLHVVNTQSYARNYTNSICAEPPEDGRVTPETN
jgi:hypothetical protein